MTNKSYIPKYFVKGLQDKTKRIEIWDHASIL